MQNIPDCQPTCPHRPDLRLGLTPALRRLRACPPSPRDLPLRPALTSPGRPSTTKHTTTHFLDLPVRLGRAACMHTCLHACAAPRAGRKRRITPARVRNGGRAMAMAKRCAACATTTSSNGASGRTGRRKARDDEMGTRTFAHAERTNRRQRREVTVRLLVYSTPCASTYVCVVCSLGDGKLFFFPPFPVVLPCRPGSETGHCCCCCGGGGDPVPWADVRTSHGKRAQAHAQAQDRHSP
jgi:hypothetical protein